MFQLFKTKLNIFRIVKSVKNVRTIYAGLCFRLNLNLNIIDSGFMLRERRFFQGKKETVMFVICEITSKETFTHYEVTRKTKIKVDTLMFINENELYDQK